MESHLDEYVQRLAHLPSFNVYAITKDGADCEPWYEVNPQEVLNDLVIREQGLGAQLQLLGAEIMKWRRYEALCHRVYLIEERKYRIWRDTLYIKNITPPPDPEEAKGWKKPTEKALEAMYRSHPDYSSFQIKSERAEDAMRGCLAVVDGLKAKRDMLKECVGRAKDDGKVGLYI